jgi:hypothetical protein
MSSSEDISELNQLCAGAKVMPEGDSVYIFLPALKLPNGCSPTEVDALLRIKSPLTDYCVFRSKWAGDSIGCGPLIPV